MDPSERDQQIIAAYTAGTRVAELARAHGLSHPRVQQILSQHGIAKRGRAYVITADDCRSALAAFVADGGHSARQYMAWSVREGAPHWITIRSRGLHDEALALFAAHRPVWDPPHKADVMLPRAPYRPAHQVWAWLVANGMESVKALGAITGHRIHVHEPATAARARGMNGWSLSEYDLVCPDNTCG